MFLHMLDDAQQRAFLALAYKMVIADGRVRPEESKALKSLRAEAEIAGTLPVDAVLGDADLSAFADPEARLRVLLNLIALGYADGEFHPRESHLFHEVASAFGIDDDTLQRFADWGRDYGTLVQRARSIVGDIDG